MSGGGLFRRPSAIPVLPSSQQSTSTSTEDTSEPRRRHGSAPLITALGISRRGSTPATSSSNATSSRRPSALDLAPPRKTSEPGTVYKPSPLSPKRKPLPKGSTFDSTVGTKDDDLQVKMGKMELTGGSTMVFPRLTSVNIRLWGSACVAIQIYDSQHQ
jgi:hypothetical protein